MSTDPNASVPSFTEAESLDLAFWKPSPGFRDDPPTVFERLREGERVEGLEELPVRDMVEAVADAFGDWDRIDELDWESASGAAFQLFTTPQFLNADCYSMTEEDRKRIVDAVAAFGCSLHEPKSDT